jgi:hypothetical protein
VSPPPPVLLRRAFHLTFSRYTRQRYRPVPRLHLGCKPSEDLGVLPIASLALPPSPAGLNDPFSLRCFNTTPPILPSARIHRKEPDDSASSINSFMEPRKAFQPTLRWVQVADLSPHHNHPSRPRPHHSPTSRLESPPLDGPYGLILWMHYWLRFEPLLSLVSFWTCEHPDGITADKRHPSTASAVCTRSLVVYWLLACPWSSQFHV